MEWTVESVEPQFGRFVLSHADGQVDSRSIRWLINHPDVRMAKEVKAVGSVTAPSLTPWPISPRNSTVTPGSGLNTSWKQ
ncbi:hypothetical protein [Streptomyces sp. NBC_00019]|uniref:hypothetical protein n=1 Tax=Streptomyces sp. NBC_00019 TaxID=2975623 RepID=UPI0032514E4F